METKMIQDMSAHTTVTDRLGRSLPVSPSVPAPKERLVGLFYFLWLGEHGRHQPYDIAKIVAAHPDAGYHPDAPYWGGVGTYHHWGEPLYGYYYSDDEWVMRRHVKLIVQAGVDFLFLDVTNAITYDHNVKKLFAVLEEYRLDGFAVPKILFYTNSASGQTVHHLYETFFKPRLYPELWLMLDGKPLIIARPEECGEEERAFFTIKLSQWPNEADKDDGWPWMDFTRPQRSFPDPVSGRTVMNASIAQHPQLRFGDSVLYGEDGNCGRSFHDGKNDKTPNAYLYGYNFGEQLDRAIEVDPSILLITGWNEWIAGRWNGIPERPIMFVDTADTEYSRDVEMMRGGYGDLYYLQMIDGIRRYKGFPAQTAAKDGQVVRFRGFADGAMHRHAEGYGTVYHNETARNAIRDLYLTKNGDSLTVRIETAAPISAQRSGTFLRTYLNVCGGQGYTHILSPEGDSVRICKADGLRLGEALGVVPCTLGERAIEFTLPLSLIGVSGEGASLEIKVADATVEYETAADFYDIGDVLPMGALNFRFLSE